MENSKIDTSMVIWFLTEMWCESSPVGIGESFQQIMLEALDIYSYGRMNLAPTLYHSKQCQMDHSSHLKTKTLKLVEETIFVIWG